MEARTFTLMSERLPLLVAGYYRPGLQRAATSGRHSHGYPPHPLPSRDNGGRYPREFTARYLASALASAIQQTLTELEWQVVHHA